ncbi:hypothetical protein DBR32_05800 [Taibaiella sp. KBW10]|uniref:uroporphyrinogen-III synthase n=1 Tax=Taibaiella sp. KBW10 TaxID=2153357 RepID=UPI000F5B047B|nr:uroporphyrinogen-III synthase [Taibaiella sp. KBW10]RQO31473.1 hypothetical protein DBR32_05800 [Taibaiella sp. KBW10]
MQKRFSILSTKELKADTLAAAEGTRFDITCIPFIRIEFVAMEALAQKPRPKGTGIFTSVNAVNAYVSGRANLPEIDCVYCIEGATSEAVQALLPEATLLATSPYAVELLLHIVAQHMQEPLYFFSGDQRLSTIPDGLTKLGIAFEEIGLYKTILQTAPVKKQYDALLFFSPSAVSSFFRTNTIAEKTTVFAIGHTTARALEGLVDKVMVCDRPREASLLQFAMEYFEQ